MKEFNIFAIDDISGIDIFYFKLILGFISAFLLSYFSIPKIIKVSYLKHLMDEPKERSSHSKRIPNLGGLALFLSISISSSIFSYELFGYCIFLFSSMVVLMFVGLMDDILVVAPDKKIYAQIITAIMIVVGSNIRIGNFFGVLGIYEINEFVSIIFTISVFIVFINSFNLIDGIDGLAGSIAIVIAASYMYSFYILENYPMVVFSIIIIGAVLGFLKYNISKKHKIFMGDTGSMLLGFLLTFMTIKFLNLLHQDAQESLYYCLPTAPAIVVAILIIPIIDTLSVSFTRIKNKKSPFGADKNHLHHKFVSIGLTHIDTTIILVLSNLIILFFAYLIRHCNVNLALFLVLISGFILIYIPYYIILYFKRKKSQ